MLIRRAEIGGRAPCDVRCARGRIVAVANELAPLAQEAVVDAGGGALIPGLHDHHIHLLALAAADSSVRCGPPAVRTLEELRAALDERRVARQWIRGVGYHESVGGDLDRHALDRLAADSPLRIQHRSGAMWILNSAAIAALGLDTGTDAPGVERDHGGRATGRLFRLDGWLRDRLGTVLPELAAVGERLAGYGVTGVTDATPDNGAATLDHLADAVRSGRLPQRLVVMGPSELPRPHQHGIERGAVKIILDQHALPDLDGLAGEIGRAHDDGRAVAVHCVTRTELVFAASALRAAGATARDRIEHASVAPPELVDLLASLPVTVVTQPGFIRERGDAYRVEVEAAELPWLYRCRGFVHAGVPLGAGTDAPFAAPDPWLAMQTAVSRRTLAGAVLGGDESLTPEQALRLFTSSAHAPGGPPRTIEVGANADLCLLSVPWQVARARLDSSDVAVTVAAGEIVWTRTDRT